MSDAVPVTETTAPSDMGDMGAFNAAMSAISPLMDAEASSENTPDPNPVGEPGEPGATTEPSTAPVEAAAEPVEPSAEETAAEESTAPSDVLAEIAKLSGEDRELLLGQFTAFLESQGKSATAPIPAPEQPAAAPEQAQQAAQPVQQASVIQPAYEPFTGDDLMDEGTFNTKIAARDAYIVRAAQQSVVPFVGMLLDVAIATREAIRENPALRGRDNEVAELVVSLRNQNPQASTDEIVEKAASQLVRTAKTIDLVKRLKAAGRPIDARPGSPPVAVAAVAPRSPNGQFAPKNPEPSPLAKTFAALAAMGR